MMVPMLLLVVAAVPASAQWLGMPVWNSPKGGTGVKVMGDVGLPSNDARGGTAFGGRASLGLSAITLTAGVSSWKPDGASESVTSLGGTAAVRVIGGALMPVNVNVIAGASTTSNFSVGLTTADLTTIVAGAGASVSLPIPGFGVEPYLSVTNRWNKISGASSTESDIGWTVGANVGLGMLGLHVAFDSQDRFGTGSSGVLGLGAHVGIGIPGL
jgi:hypothetical protein